MENPKCKHNSMICSQTYNRRKVRFLACDDLPKKFHPRLVRAEVGSTGSCGPTVDSMKRFVRSIRAMHAEGETHAERSDAACDRASRPRTAIV